ncbi:unnamed protein product [Urochloa decumbens]|uniref:Disease resistance N-terminal domain-containing protein n=1 Tax=Urochloa decumbens TaxID=240449 RepID=A0ABC9A7P1_9POAL
METFLSAVLSDLFSRSVSFVLDNYNRRRQKGAKENLQQLHCVLLRIQAIVEEAEGRHITNQSMLQQLQMLREAMYKGCYLLDTSTHQMQQQERSNDQVGGHLVSLSKFSPAKRVRLASRSMSIAFQGDGVEVQKMLGSLHSIIGDMAEFIVFLKSYPPLSREPYSKYLVLENCMFGRQAEMEKIISFLLQPEPPGAKSLQVLPIIGPPRVGKSTLVEHVCYDERVRSHFSTIILCSGDPTAPEGSGVVKKQTHGSHGRSLVVVELAEDLVLDERQCRSFFSSRSHMPPGSKFIVTSRSENILKLGSTGAIKLDVLSEEAYWYFFKVMAFGSTNPDDHPELASLAMEIAARVEGCFVAANTISEFFLRANMHRSFWNKILECLTNNVERNTQFFGEHPRILLEKNQIAYVWSLSHGPTRLKVLYYQTLSPMIDVPKITLHEVQTSAKGHGKLDVLVWKSRIPPYHSYIMKCEIEASQDMMAKKKHPRSYIQI